MADPELSLQGILMVAAVIGWPKTCAYAGWVAWFSIAAGLLYGAWVAVTGHSLLALGLFAFAAVRTSGLAWLQKRRQAALQIK